MVPMTEPSSESWRLNRKRRSTFASKPVVAPQVTRRPAGARDAEFGGRPLFLGAPAWDRHPAPGFGGGARAAARGARPLFIGAQAWNRHPAPVSLFVTDPQDGAAHSFRTVFVAVFDTAVSLEFLMHCAPATAIRNTLGFKVLREVIVGDFRFRPDRLPRLHGYPAWPEIDFVCFVVCLNACFVQLGTRQQDVPVRPGVWAPGEALVLRPLGLRGCGWRAALGKDRQRGLPIFVVDPRRESI